MRQNQIDRNRWDAIAAEAPVPYGLSWWLDAVTDGRWYGIVEDDYEYIWPLPVSRSFLGLLQFKRAPFTQQSGPFGRFDRQDLQEMLECMPRRVITLTIPLSETISPEDFQASLPVRSRTNLLLDLSAPLQDIRKGYGKTLRKKLRRYPTPSLEPSTPDTVMEVYQNSSGQRAGLKKTHYRKIRQLMEACLENGGGHLYQVLEQGQVLAAGFFPEHRGRIINLFAGSTEVGFQHDGMARLLDAVIQNHRGEDQLLDFEGSDIPGVQSFFRSFGAVDRPYSHITR